MAKSRFQDRSAILGRASGPASRRTHRSGFVQDKTPGKTTPVASRPYRSSSWLDKAYPEPETPIARALTRRLNLLLKNHHGLTGQGCCALGFRLVCGTRSERGRAKPPPENEQAPVKNNHAFNPAHPLHLSLGKSLPDRENIEIISVALWALNSVRLTIRTAGNPPSLLSALLWLLAP